jgi:hypothetical protein
MQLEVAYSPAAPGSILKKRNSFLRTPFDSPGNESICRGFIAVADHRDDLHQVRPSVLVDQFDKTNEFLAQKGTKKFAPVEKRQMVLFYLSERFSKMFERTPLAQRMFIMDALNPRNQSIIERHLTYFESLLSGLADHVTGLVIQLSFPPMLVITDRKDRQRFTLAMVIKFWLRIGQALSEGEQVNPRSQETDFLDGIRRLVIEFISLSPYSGRPDNTSGECEIL